MSDDNVTWACLVIGAVLFWVCWAIWVYSTQPRLVKIHESKRKRSVHPIEDFACSCGSKDFLAGPCGGMCQNIKCKDCRKTYNVTPFDVVPLD